MCVCLSSSKRKHSLTHSPQSLNHMNRNKSYEDDDDNPLDRNKTKWTDLKRNLHTREGGVSQACNNDSSIPPTPGDVGGGGGGNGSRERTPWARWQGRSKTAGRYRARTHHLTVPEALDLLRRMKGGKGRRAARAARTVSLLLRDPTLRVSNADRLRILRSGASLRAWRRVAQAMAEARRRRRVRKNVPQVLVLDAPMG